MPKITIGQKVSLIIFGLLLCVILLEIALRLGGFIFLSLQEYRNRLALKQRGTCRIMCLGGSTTAGSGGSDVYPGQLQQVLNKRNIGIKFSVVNKGLPGINSTGILSQLENNLNKYSPDMVIAMIGANDEMIFEERVTAPITMPYEDSPANRTALFLKSLRTYKLVKLLRLHVISKSKEIGIYKPKTKQVSSDKIDEPLQRYKQQEKMYEENIKRNPVDYRAYIELGNVYVKQGKYVQAEEIFKKAAKIDPADEKAYLHLVDCYVRWAKPEVEEVIKKILKINPENEGAYISLGRIYLDRKKYIESEEMFKKAIEINPSNYRSYHGLANCYLKMTRDAEAEEMVEKALELEPENHWLYIEIGRAYLERQMYVQAEKIFKKAVEIDPGNDYAYGALALLYKKWKKYGLAEEYPKKADGLRLEYYNPMTRRNYRRIREILEQRDIKLVCVQYPMRNIEPLKKLFGNTEGMIFVDNEKIFKQAVEESGYDAYFTDYFAGDFEHCTPKGNRLLAENIANVILREVFNK